MVNFPEKDLSKYEILDRGVAAEKKSGFDRWEKNLFETEPHLTSSPAIPWGDEVRHFVVEGYKRFIHNEDWCGEGEIQMQNEVISMMGGLLGSENAAILCGD